MVTMPPLVVRIRASSTVLVKASSLVNLDFGGMVAVVETSSLGNLLGVIETKAEAHDLEQVPVAALPKSTCDEDSKPNKSTREVNWRPEAKITSA